MESERLEFLNTMISEQFEQILADQENEVSTEDQLIAETYARMIALSVYGFNLGAMAESADAAADRVMDLFESMNKEEETV